MVKKILNAFVSSKTNLLLAFVKFGLKTVKRTVWFSGLLTHLKVHTVGTHLIFSLCPTSFQPHVLVLPRGRHPWNGCNDYHVWPPARVVRYGLLTSPLLRLFASVFYVWVRTVVLNLGYLIETDNWTTWISWEPVVSQRR